MIIDVLGDGLVVRIKKKNERNGMYVMLGIRHPECEHCHEPGDNCQYCEPGKDLVEKPTYVLTVQYDDMSQTKDEFESFFDAFDSFTNIVKTLIKQEDV